MRLLRADMCLSLLRRSIRGSYLFFAAFLGADLFFGAAFLVAFFAAFFFATFFAVPFFAAFLGGTFLPSLRASERPIAMACFRLVTVFPLLPLLSWPRFSSCIALST